MKLDYGTQISPFPIPLSIGTLRKPTLKDISEIGYERFGLYESFTKLTPKLFYTKLNKENGGEKYWESLGEDEQYKLTMFGLLCDDDVLQKMYTALLDFFFVESVQFVEKCFVIYDGEKDVDLSQEDNIKKIKGVITLDTFNSVMTLIQQVCGIYDDAYDLDGMTFKSEFAKRKYLEFLENKKEAEEKKEKKADKNMSIPNIISAVANKHQSLNYVNIWQLTLFQLLDVFHRLQTNTIYDIDSTRVSVWGDEKNTFDISLWYKNEYDKS